MTKRTVNPTIRIPSVFIINTLSRNISESNSHFFCLDSVYFTSA